MYLTKAHKNACTCSLISCLLLANICFSQSKSLTADNLQIHFLKDSLQTESNSFAFNSCSILYLGTGTIQVEARLKVPGLVDLVSSPSALFTLSNTRQHLLPIRFIAQSVLSAEWHRIEMTFFIKETGQQVEKSFWIKPKSELKWRAGLLQQEMSVSEHEESAMLNFWIENTGNVADDYEISFASDISSMLPKRTNVRLQANAKKIISVPVNVVQLRQSREKSLVINLNIKNTAGGEKMFVQKISLLTHKFSQQHFAWKRMPLTVEMSAQKGFNTKTIFSASLAGTLALNNTSVIAVDARFINLSEPSPNNRFTTIHYQSPKWTLTAGRMINFDHFTINGNGLSISNKNFRATTEIAAVKSNSGSINQLKLKNSTNFTNSLNFSSDNFFNGDNTLKINSLLSVNKLQWKISSKTMIAVAGGASVEKINAWKKVQKLSGSMHGYNFETSWRKTHITSKAEVYSKSFAGFNKGYTFHDHELKKQFNKASLSAFYFSNKKIYTNNLDSLFSNLFNINNSEYGIKGGFSNEAISVFVSSGMSKQQQDSTNSLVVKSWKTAANLIWKITPDYVLSIGSNAGLNSMAGRGDIKPFIGFNNYGSLQRNGVGVYFQLSSGPFYYFEAKEFIQTKNEFSRIQVAPFYEQQLKSLNSFLRLQLMVNKEQPAGSNFVSFNNQFIFSPTALQAELSLNSSVNFTRKEASYVYMSVRKSLHVPVTKNSVSNNFTVLLFQDKNNNSAYDEAIDEIIPRAMVMVNEQLVQSNEKGEIVFSNIGAGAIRINLSNINNRGWLPKHGLIQTIVPAKKIKRHFIPFNKSKAISGRLISITDDKSSEIFDLNYIRITATDEAGNTFSTLTDATGAFNLNLPAANYIVSINGAAFDDRFRPTELSKPADLVNNEHLTMSFEIRQKKRQINIQRADN